MTDGCRLAYTTSRCIPYCKTGDVFVWVLVCVENRLTFLIRASYFACRRVAGALCRLSRIGTDPLRITHPSTSSYWQLSQSGRCRLPLGMNRGCPTLTHPNLDVLGCVSRCDKGLVCGYQHHDLRHCAVTATSVMSIRQSGILAHKVVLISLLGFKILVCNVFLSNLSVDQDCLIAC